MTKAFTGRHMAVTIIGFFAVVIAVNLVMAMAATRTFGGTVVDNSYVASQKFNRWLDEAEAEKALGWSVQVDRDGDHAGLALARPAGAIGRAHIQAVARHPLGALPDLALRFREVAPGRYRSIEPLPAGRWRLQLDIRDGGQRGRFLGEVPA